MHIGLCDVLDDDGNIVVPPSNRLVIRCRQEPSIVIDPGNCVDRAQMLVVLLRDLLLSQIVLNRWIKVSFVHGHTSSRQSAAYLNDLLILHTSQEDVLLVFIRVELDTVGDLAVRERLYALTCSESNMGLVADGTVLSSRC